MNCQILHMEYFAMLCCTLNHSAIKAAFHTYLRFRERFLVENYIHAFKKPEKVSAKIHCTHCVNAVPKHGSGIRQKRREIYFLTLKIRTTRQPERCRYVVRGRVRPGMSIQSQSLATELRHQCGTVV